MASVYGRPVHVEQRCSDVRSGGLLTTSSVPVGSQRAPCLLARRRRVARRSLTAPAGARRDARPRRPLRRSVTTGAQPPVARADAVLLCAQPTRGNGDGHRTLEHLRDEPPGAGRGLRDRLVDGRLSVVGRARGQRPLERDDDLVREGDAAP